MFFRCCSFVFFKQKTAYEMRISDWSSDVCSSDLGSRNPAVIAANLDHNGPPDFKNCILVDDVKSTGGHLKGAARYLHGLGINVVGAFCVAQTVNIRPASIFDIPSETINPPPGFFDF